MFREYFFLFLFLYLHGKTIKSQKRSNLLESHQGGLQINNILEPLIHPKLSTKNSSSKGNILLKKAMDVHNHRNKFIKRPSSLKPILHTVRYHGNSSIFEPSVRDAKVLTETDLKKYNSGPFVTWGERKKTRRHHVLYPWELCEEWVKNEDGEKILHRAQRKYDDITFQPYPFQLLGTFLTLLLIRFLKVNNIFNPENETKVIFLSSVWNNIVYKRFSHDYSVQSKLIKKATKDSSNKGGGSGNRSGGNRKASTENKKTQSDVKQTNSEQAQQTVSDDNTASDNNAASDNNTASNNNTASDNENVSANNEAAEQSQGSESDKKETDEDDATKNEGSENQDDSEKKGTDEDDAKKNEGSENQDDSEKKETKEKGEGSGKKCMDNNGPLKIALFAYNLFNLLVSSIQLYLRFSTIKYYDSFFENYEVIGIAFFASSAFPSLLGVGISYFNMHALITFRMAWKQLRICLGKHTEEVKKDSSTEVENKEFDEIKGVKVPQGTVDRIGYPESNRRFIIDDMNVYLSGFTFWLTFLFCLPYLISHVIPMLLLWPHIFVLLVVIFAAIVFGISMVLPFIGRRFNRLIVHEPGVVFNIWFGISWFIYVIIIIEVQLGYLHGIWFYHGRNYNCVLHDAYFDRHRAARSSLFAVFSKNAQGIPELLEFGNLIL